MISIDDHPPPDPSSSHHNRHHQQQIAHDLNVSDIDLKSPDVDLHDTCNTQLPNFSIRDYVFGLRSKDVACNWPFSSTSLQLCLKHGVKNLLPPFQSLENRSHDEEETLISFHGKPRNDRRKSNAEQASGSVTVTVSTNSSGFKRDNRSQFQFQQHVAHTRSKENTKKSKLVMKLNQGVEQVEEISMASKICPVCKVFSSSSNTTLNAHIDQCLTGDQGTMKWTDNPKVVVKHRVKPRKTRLMVEIYKTAPHCTIEELDRRNGTNWATNSSFPAQEFQFDHGDEEEEEKEEARTITTVNRDVADNEGDVYIDTDGTKVRILSVPKSGSMDDNNLGDRKLLKGVKGSKFVMSKKKFKRDLHKQKHHKKFLKLIPNARKLCSLKSQARNEEDDVNCSKDERPRNRLADLAIVRPPWACSKRTNLAKRKHRKNLRIIESDKSSSRCDLGSPPLSSDEVAVSQSRKKTKTSSPLMAEFRKESSRMHDDDDDDDDNGASSDSSPSENSDHSFETRSKVGGKLLRKNLSLKTKSSSHSSKENSRNEEHVRKNDVITRSVTSKSSNEEESSIGVETADVDALHDLESVRNDQTLPNLDHDQVCVLQPPPNFTGLSNSFDPDFSKCVELYQEQLLSCSTNRVPEVEKHDFFFHEDDPIPIPGPPGSFLPPSPGGDMVSDEQQLQANSSSTTTTRIPSTETHHNHDRDSMSNSPVSTVSNPSNLARSESRSTSVVQEDHTKPGFLVNGMHTKSLTSFKNDPQPCCCSRKDAAFSYNIQESSTNVRRQSIESNKSSTPIGFNFRSDTFPLSNYSISQAPETAIFPTMKKPPDYGGSDSTTTTPSKPVLRLMGKNLTVVKTDENIQPFRPPQPPPVIFNGFQNGSNVYPPVSHGGFMDRYGHGGGYMGHTVPQARAHHDHNSREIIIIDKDDLPGNELDDSMRSENLRRNRGQMNPLYTMYQAQSSGHHMYSGGGGGGGSTVVRGGSFNGDLGKWDVGLGASSPSRSMSHMRSSTSYYPPSYP